MKPLLLGALLIAAIALVGCETLEDATSSMRDRLSAREATRSKTYAPPPRVVFDAVKLAAANMGYRQTRGGAAQGEFDGVSGVGPGEVIGTAQQRTIKVRLTSTLEGGTNVAVRFTEILESDSGTGRGLGTETTMKDTPLYEVFFRNVQSELDARPAAAPVK